jgi:hypothetical protein
MTQELYQREERRRHPRSHYLQTFEFCLNTGDVILKGITLNISDSGMCIYALNNVDGAP